MVLNWSLCKKLSWPEIDFDKSPKRVPLISNIESSISYLKFLNDNENLSLRFTMELGDELLVRIFELSK